MMPALPSAINIIVDTCMWHLFSIFACQFKTSKLMKKVFSMAILLLFFVTVEAKDVKRVACIGNSITKGSWLSHPERDSYPSALKRMLGDGWEVDNRAVSGACVSEDCKNVYMNTSDYGKVKESHPDVVTIFLGHDDARTSNQKGLGHFADGLAKMVKDLKGTNGNMRIFLVTPTKVSSKAWGNDDDAIRTKVIPAIKEVAQKENVPVVDVYTTSEPKYFPDGVHPDANGAGRIAQALYKAITGKNKQFERPLSVPSLFSDHAVLQQRANVSVWGYGAAGKKVVVKPSWGKAVSTTADADGKWSLRVPTPEASYTKYSMKISQNGQNIELKDLLIGEVWLASGQSNMQMELGGYYRTAVIGGPEAIANSANDGLRLYRVPRGDSQRPQDDVLNKGWEVSSPASTVHFSATGYFFARQLQKVLNIPVGCIESANGGASVVSFMSQDAVNEYKDVRGEGITQYYKDFKAPGYGEKYTWPQHTPTVIYNAMIHPLLTYNIKGAIWYQGCDDRRHPQLYKKLFKTFLADWRSKWQCGNFPIYYAQIAPYGYNDGNGPLMREAQEQLESVKDSALMICLMDNGLEKNIHPDNKPVVGFRFAQRVLDKTYHVEGINSEYPHYKSMEVRKKDGKVVLRFTGADDGIAKKAGPITGFQIAGKDKTFYNVEAKDEGNTIVLTPPAGVTPCAVRYCFKDYCVGSVYNMRGNPLSSFRTDTWDK